MANCLPYHNKTIRRLPISQFEIDRRRSGTILATHQNASSDASQRLTKPKRSLRSKGGDNNVVDDYRVACRALAVRIDRRRGWKLDPSAAGYRRSHTHLSTHHRPKSRGLTASPTAIVS